MTAAHFRRLALALAGAAEHAHMGHPDFRVNGRIFATLGYPDDGSAMVKLAPDEQAEFIRDQPGVFSPAAGAWGLQGATMVRLAEADEESVGIALTAAWRRATAMKLPGTKAGRTPTGRRNRSARSTTGKRQK